MICRANHFFPVKSTFHKNKRFLFSVRIFPRQSKRAGTLPAEQKPLRTADSLSSAENIFGVATRQKSGSKSFFGRITVITCRRTLKELERTTRKPTLLLRLLGELLFRLDTEQLFALLFQAPPRLTRLEPEAEPVIPCLSGLEPYLLHKIFRPHYMRFTIYSTASPCRP